MYIDYLSHLTLLVYSSLRGLKNPFIKGKADTSLTPRTGKRSVSFSGVYVL
jgi:hypothetical protein